MGEAGHRCPGGAGWVGAESRASLNKADTQWASPLRSSLHVTRWEGHSPASILELFLPSHVPNKIKFKEPVKKGLKEGRA